MMKLTRLFEKEECFDGEMPIERNVQSVPDKLIKLISMILEGGDFSGSLSTVCIKYPPISHSLFVSTA